MSRLRSLIDSLRAFCIRVYRRFISHVDERAEKAVNEWGSTMEYRRRYTNPDEAKKSRKPVD